MFAGYSQQTQIDYNSTPLTIYVGSAYSGVTPTDPYWSITRITLNSAGKVVAVLMSGGVTGFLFKWSERTTIDYK